MLWKRMIATLTAILMLLCCIAPAIAQEAPTGSTIAAAASGVVRLLSIDADGGYAGASAFGIGTVGEKTDTFVTSYSAVTDANGAPVQSIYILTEDVSLTVTSTTPYKTVKKEDVAQDAIEGQNQAREAVTIERSLVYEGFTPERHIKCEVLGYSSDQNFAVLRASRAPDDRVALSLYGGTELGIGSAIAVVGYTDPVATFATERQELRGNRGWWTVDTAAYTITAAQSYVNCITGFINQYDQTGGASFLHSAATSNSSEGGALVTESGQVAGVATAPVRYLYAPTQPEEALSSDYTGVYIADVISLLERRSIAYGAQQAPTAEPETTETPTEEPETTETPTGEPETVEPIPEPGFFEKLATLARENLLIVILVAVLVVLIVIVLIALIRGRGAPRAHLTAEDVDDDLDDIDGVTPTQPARSAERAPVSTLGLRGVKGELQDKYYRLDSRLRIGRDPRQNDVLYPVQTKGVSSVHCVLTLRDGRVYIEDVGSTYGTFINGSQRLAKGQLIELHVGDHIGVGSERETLVVANKGGN